MKMLMKNRYNIKRRRPRHRHKYTKYKTGFNMFIFIKQYLNNISGSVHEKS